MIKSGEVWSLEYGKCQNEYRNQLDSKALTFQNRKFNQFQETSYISKVLLLLFLFNAKH